MDLIFQNPLIQAPILLALAILLSVRTLDQTLELNKPHMTKGLVGFLSLLLVWLWLEIFFLPLTSWLFPMLKSEDFRLLGSLLFFVFFVFLLVFWGANVLLEEAGHQKFWLKFWQLHEKTILFFLPQIQHDYYQCHLRWRFLLLGRKIVRKWERVSVKGCLSAQRWLWVLLAGGAACTIAMWFITQGKWFELPTIVQLKELQTSTGSWTLLTALISAPIAFVIWWFRDTNTLWQIENQRKDTNLKDFQKLSEWVSGLHLIEFETKRKSEPNDSNPALLRVTSEEVVFTQPMTPNNNRTLSPPSRAVGAASLQIAAVYQLQAFLRGDFGKHFQRPAFALLRTVWLALVQAHLRGWKKDFAHSQARGEFSSNEQKTAFLDWIKYLHDLTESPLAFAISDALTREHGLALHYHVDELSDGIFAGLFAKDLELNYRNLEAIQLQGAKLTKAQLQGSNLRNAKLQGAVLQEAFLQSANLESAQCQGANFIIGHMQGAHCQSTQFTGASLQGAQFQNADLSYSDLQGSNLFNANFRGAKLDRAYLHCATLGDAIFCDADLSNAKLIGAFFNSRTQFQNCVTNRQTFVEADAPLEFSEAALRAQALRTHALRLMLRERNGLVLHESAYTQYLDEWDDASSEEQYSAKANCRYEGYNS